MAVGTCILYVPSSQDKYLPVSGLMESNLIRETLGVLALSSYLSSSITFQVIVVSGCSQLPAFRSAVQVLKRFQLYLSVPAGKSNGRKIDSFHWVGCDVENRISVVCLSIATWALGETNSCLPLRL